MSRIFLDMDGVLADFPEGLRKNGVIHPASDRLMQSFVDKSGWTEDELTYDDEVHRCMSTPGFFRNLPVMKDAHKLWAVVPDPIVLTARPKDEAIASRVRREKREWIEETFGELPDDRFICCLRSEKARYAIEVYHEQGWSTPLIEPNILVDDLGWNCSEWKRAGGRAVLFKDMDQAVEELSRLVKERK